MINNLNTTLILILLLSGNFLFSQKIVTDTDGTKIALYSDGTWEYIDMDKDELFKTSSEEVNKMCPMQIDEYTVLTNSVYFSGNFVYSYIMDDNIFDEYDISKYDWEKRQHQMMKNTFCTDPEFEPFRAYGINVAWKYYNPQGKHISKLEVHPDSCR